MRASFSQKRMTYAPETGQVIYQSKDGQRKKVFDALEWLAAMTSHIPNKGESRSMREFAITGNTVMYPAAGAKRQAPMSSYPPFWNLCSPQRPSGKTGHA
jgi:hypothetical protein